MVSIEEATLRGSVQWRALAGNGEKWRGWGAGPSSPAALDDFVMDQARAGHESALYVEISGARTVQVRLERLGDNDVLALAQDVSSLAQPLGQRWLDAVRQRHLAALSEFHARRVVHELCNSLCAIELRVSFGKSLDAAPPSELGLFTDIEHVIAKARQRVDQLRPMSAEPATAELEAHSVVRPFDGLEPAVELARRDGASVTVDPQVSGLPLVAAVEDDLTLVFVLLLDNAREAGAAAYVHADVRAEALEIHVSDDGPGLGTGSTTRLWKPFFTTKDPPHRGHGLPLALEVVRRNGGSLSAMNRPDRTGARFTLTLRRAGA